MNEAAAADGTGAAHRLRRLGLQFREPALERAYRAHFLASDRRNAIVALLVFVVFKAGFGLFDLLWQTLPVAEQLLAVRFGFVLASIAFMVVFARVRLARHFDALMLAWTALAAIANFFTIIHRPSDHFGFVSTSPILIILLFAFFRNRMALQLVAVATLIAGDAFTLVFLREPLAQPELVQIGATYLLSLIVGLVVGWQLKRSRRDYFATLQRERELALRLHEYAYRDDLTGVLNRRSFMIRANATWSQARAQGGDACVLMLDLDHFKAINDRFGHDAGDEALRGFARLVAANIRPEDLFGRIGGEEFALFLPATGLREANRIAQMLVDACASAELIVAGSEKLTVSIGMAAIRRSDISINMALIRADKALYRAKADGRARCIEFDESVDSTAP